MGRLEEHYGCIYASSIAIFVDVVGGEERKAAFPAGIHEVASPFIGIKISSYEGCDSGVHCELVVVQVIPDNGDSVVRESGGVVIGIMGGVNRRSRGGGGGWNWS